MSEKRSDRIQREVESLRTTRDELRVQLHLAAAEARDGWNELEQSWHHLEAHLKRLTRVASEATEDVEEAAGLLVDELKNGYERVRELM